MDRLTNSWRRRGWRALAGDRALAWLGAAHSSATSHLAPLINVPHYNTFCVGTVRFGPWRRIQKIWAPSLCKFFIWLVFHNRCWTVDRLEKRGLPCPEACPLCDQAEETSPYPGRLCIHSSNMGSNLLIFGSQFSIARTYNISFL